MSDQDFDFDQALILDGEDDDIIPVWDGVQYVGGAQSEELNAKIEFQQ